MKIVRRIIVFALLVCYSTDSSSQTLRSSLHLPLMSSAQFSPEFAGALSFCDNSSIFPLEKGFGAGMYSEKKYMVEHLNLVVFAAAFFREKSAAGFSLQYFGEPLYNEMQIKFNYGKSLGKITIGASISYHILNIQGAEKLSSINMNVTSCWKLSDNVYAGLLIGNPHLPKIKNNSNASYYKTGIGYRASSKVYAGFCLSKEENRSMEVIACLQYHFADQFFGKAGFISGSNMPFLGVGWTWENIKIELIIGQHYALGASPALSFNYLKLEAK